MNSRSSVKMFFHIFYRRPSLKRSICEPSRPVPIDSSVDKLSAVKKHHKSTYNRGALNKRRHLKAKCKSFKKVSKNIETFNSIVSILILVFSAYLSSYHDKAINAL